MSFIGRSLARTARHISHSSHIRYSNGIINSRRNFGKFFKRSPNSWVNFYDKNYSIGYRDSDDWKGPTNSNIASVIGSYLYDFNDDTDV